MRRTLERAAMSRQGHPAARRSASKRRIAYVVMAFAVGAQAFFEPARTATIPNVTAPEDLLAANALSSATWSASSP